jgi:hypothetical protein
LHFITTVYPGFYPPTKVFLFQIKPLASAMV